MYENITYELILQRMMDRIPNSFDKREGSIIYDALAPAALELRQLYLSLEKTYNEMFADTASREYLIKRAAERGVTPKEATKTLVVGEILPTTLIVEKGSRFSCDTVNFVVTEKIGDGLYHLECETAGVIGNMTSGILLPINNINGLVSANIVDIEVYGSNEEDTENFRNRYFESLGSEAFGGNKTDYRIKAKSYSGVGGCKVYSGAEWNGGGSVKLVILSNHYDVPSDYLIESLQTYFDPEDNQGVGNGVAPIGHFVTVVPVDTTTVNIGIKITYAADYNWDLVKSSVEKVIDDYFLELNIGWEKYDNITVRIAQIESRILNVKGILDVRDATINGRSENLVIHPNAIIVRGTINE